MSVIKRVIFSATTLVCIICSCVQYRYVNEKTPEPIFVEYSKGEVFEKDNIDCSINDIKIFSESDFCSEYDINDSDITFYNTYKNQKFIMIPFEIYNNGDEDRVIDFASLVIKVGEFTTCLDLEIYNMLNPEICVGMPVVGLRPGSEAIIELPFTIPEEYYEDGDIDLYMSIYPEKKYVDIV